MASDPSTQSRVMFQAPEKTEEPAKRKLGKLTVKYNRKDLQRRLDIEEWIDEQLHLLFDCEVGESCLCTERGGDERKAQGGWEVEGLGDGGRGGEMTAGSASSGHHSVSWSRTQLHGMGLFGGAASASGPGVWDSGERLGAL